MSKTRERDIRKIAAEAIFGALVRLKNQQDSGTLARGRALFAGQSKAYPRRGQKHEARGWLAPSTLQNTDARPDFSCQSDQPTPEALQVESALHLLRRQNYNFLILHSPVQKSPQVWLDHASPLQRKNVRVALGRCSWAKLLASTPNCSYASHASGKNCSCPQHFKLIPSTAQSQGFASFQSMYSMQLPHDLAI